MIFFSLPLSILYSFNIFPFSPLPLKSTLLSFMTTTKSTTYNNRRMSLIYSDQEDHEESTPTSRPTFTPCTRMSNLTLTSQSTTEYNGRTRIITRHQRPATDFNTKLKRAFQDEQSSEQQQPHPNLSMVLGGEKISFDDRFQRDMSTRGMFFQSSEDESDEDDDDEDLLRSFSSPEHSPSASPERFTLDSIFDMNVKLPSPQGFGQDSPQQTPSITEPQQDEHYDPTFSWVNQIYEDDSSDVYDMMNDRSDAYFGDDDKTPIAIHYTDYDENRPPQPIKENNNTIKRGKTRSWACSNNNTSSASSSSSSSSAAAASSSSSLSLSENKRTPLQELPLEDTLDDNDDLHPRKKVILNKKISLHSISDNDYRAPVPSPSTSRSRKPFMRALSPSAMSRNKGKEPASN
ncbi:hypothetical protein BDA99DRAFT_72340 [Phascolomyces articulosus]|uniref:Uncharacterized protein n=1 Tax=Phascolomyces articulosus TaxID=60185 RepID=A0AAD5JZP7_9FUNG|nr:hypothetical protein BDA99DRAFT_72340 [Phascolomyces articulosus]